MMDIIDIIEQTDENEVIAINNPLEDVAADNPLKPKSIYAGLPARIDDKPTVVVFDADSIIWTVAYKYRNKKTAPLVKQNVAKFILDILQRLEADYYIGYFGSKDTNRTPNFRYTIYNDYKANRPDEPDWITKWRPVIVKVFEETFKFIAIDGMEADDACSIAANKLKGDYNVVITSPDKDLKQIPDVFFYDYKKGEFSYSYPLEAAKALGRQMLQGDTSDNIKGLPKIGKVSAAKIIDNATSVKQVIYKVIRTYAEFYKKRFIMELRTTLKTIKDDDVLKEFSGNNTPTLTRPQLNRLKRIKAQDIVEQKGIPDLPGGWKEYLKLHYQLLGLLIDKPGFSVTPIETPVSKPAPSDDFVFKHIAEK
jgi:5'-3' exonuclease